MPAEPRRPLLAANWKMNPLTEADAAALARAVSSASSSTRLAPTSLPSALKKVLAMAPPTRRASTLGSRCRSTPAFVEILAPPTMATSGRRGSSTARWSAVSSASISRPA